MTRSTRTIRTASALLALPLALAFAASPAQAVDKPSKTDRSASDAAAAPAAAPVVAAAPAAAPAVKPEKADRPDKADSKADSKVEAAPARKAEAAPKTEAPARTVQAAPAPAPAPAKAPAKAGTSADSDKHGTATSGPLTSPQPISKADANGTGANPGTTCTHAYCSTRDGSASENGKGDGTATGKPCAGCVGKADNKNPKGQAPNGSDHNAGYECDRNQGIGKGNPAHTGCTTTPTVVVPVPVLCPNGAAMPAGGLEDCPVKPVRCPNGSAMPTGGAKDCNPVKPVLCPNGSAMPTGATSCSLPTTVTPTTVTPTTVTCSDGSALPTTGAKDCPTPVTCPNGATMPAGATSCTPTMTPTLPTGPVLGPPTGIDVPTALPIGEVTPLAPSTQPDGIVPNSAVSPQTVLLPTLTGTSPNSAATLVQARTAPSSLPFTGSDLTLLVALSALLLGGGTVLTVATRRERTARTAR